MDVTKILIEPLPIKPEKRYGKYRIRLEDGTVLLERARDPEFDACRALLDRGIRGTLETYRQGSEVCGMRIDIAAGAKMRTAESEKKGLQMTAYAPHPNWSAVSSSHREQIRALEEIFEVGVPAE